MMQPCLICLHDISLVAQFLAMCGESSTGSLWSAAAAASSDRLLKTRQIRYEGSEHRTNGLALRQRDGERTVGGQ